MFFSLLILAPVATLLVGFQITSSTALPTPGIPTGLVQLSCPLQIFLGVGRSGLFGTIRSGLLVCCACGIHTVCSTMLEMALLAGIFSAAIRQRYRTLYSAYYDRP